MNGAMSAIGTKRTSPSAPHMSAFDPKRTPAAANHGTLNDARTSGSSSRLRTNAPKRNFVALVTFGDQDFVTAAQDLPSLRCFLFRQHIGESHA